MEEKSDKKNKRKKIQLIVAISLTVLAAVSSVTLAWFSQQAGIGSVVKVKNPSVIQIMSGHCEDVSNVDIGNINLKDIESDPIIEETDSGTTYSKQYVFCVGAEKDNYAKKNYHIQIGYTTNLPFTYTLYKATELPDPVENSYTADQTTKLGNGIYTEYLSEDQVTKYLYQKGNEVTLTKIDTKLSDTYDSFTNVQANVIPEYYKTEVQKPADLTGEAAETWSFADYYVLKVTWDKSVSDTVQDNKETDMVYIVVYECTDNCG